MDCKKVVNLNLESIFSAKYILFCIKVMTCNSCTNLYKGKVVTVGHKVLRIEERTFPINLKYLPELKHILTSMSLSLQISVTDF